MKHETREAFISPCSILDQPKTARTNGLETSKHRKTYRHVVLVLFWIGLSVAVRRAVERGEKMRRWSRGKLDE